MRITIILVLCAGFYCSYAQFTKIPVRAFDTRSAQQDSIEIEPKYLTLPFWEDFSTSGDTPDTSLWKSGINVYVNDALAKNPPTYKVATFDGLKGDGTAYNLTSDFNAVTDSLVSHFIDLSIYAPEDALFMSFFWQAGGHGELPDEEDSLSLFFLNADSTWIQQKIWTEEKSIPGIPTNISDQFRQVIIPVDDPQYFHQNFKFKFQSYTLQTGPFDVWHIDYIFLNHSRTANDTSFHDRAVTGKPNMLFAPYFEIPASVFFKDPNRYLSRQSSHARNLEKANSDLTFHYQLQNLTTNESYYDGQIPAPVTVPTSLEGYQSVDITAPTGVSIPAQTDPLDSQVVESRFYLSTQDTILYGFDDEVLMNLRQNDTIRQHYLLHGHYAYDDGIAEYAAGINVKLGKLAVRYVLHEPDTLTHIDIHFPSIKPSSLDKSINVMVWSSLDEEVIRTTQPYRIEPNFKKNEFKRIRLSASKLVSDTIYIGIQQINEDYIGIGFDRNNQAASSNIFYKTGDAWVQNDRLNGIFMIRPVFLSDSTFVLGQEPQVAIDYKLYPNPSTGSFRVDQPYEMIEVFDLSGTRVYSSRQTGEHFIDRRKGIFVVRIHNKNSTASRKLIIR